MIRVVIDPGVLIAALLSPRGAPSTLLRLWLEGRFELIVSVELLAELSRVLAREKFRAYVTLDEAEEYVALFHRVATVVRDPPPEAGLTPDPGDDYLVALARAVHADVLISGDKHLIGLVDPNPTILTPGDLLGKLAPG